MESQKPLIDSPPSYDDIGIVDRNKFIKKVYSILYIQLLFTIGTCSLFIYNENIKTFIQGKSGQPMFITCIVFQLVLMIVLACTNIHRKKPWNYILLSLFTAFLSYTLGVTSSYYNTDSLLLAGGATSVVTLGLTLYAFQTKYDFTSFGPYLLSLLLVLIFAGIMSSFIKSSIYNLIYSSIGAILFSFYIIYDTQLIIGGKHKKYQFSEDEFVFAALTLYLDIVNLFLFLLNIISNKN